MAVQGAATATAPATPPSVNFDVAGARSAGYSDAEIANYLSSQAGFDAAGARKAGYADDEIISHLTAPKSAPPQQQDTGPTPLNDEEGEAFNAIRAHQAGAPLPLEPEAKAFAGEAIKGAGSALSGIGRIADAGEKSGADLLLPALDLPYSKMGAAVTKFGDKEFSNTPDEQNSLPVQVAGVAGGLADYVGASMIGGTEAVMGTAGLQGFNDGYTNAKKAGSSDSAAAIAGTLNGLTQAGLMAIPFHTAMKVLDVLPENLQAPYVKALAAAAISGTTMTAFSQLSTLADNVIARNTYDPARPLLQGVGQNMPAQFIAGAALPFAGPAARATVDVAKEGAKVMATPGNVDAAIKTAQDVVASVPVDIEGTAAKIAAEQTQNAAQEAPARQNEGEAVQSTAAEETPPAASLEAQQPNNDLAQQGTQEKTEQDAADKARFLETGEEPQSPVVAETRPSPAPQEPAYSEARVRAQTYQRWLGELDAKRQQEATASPQAALLQRTADVIMGKVKGPVGEDGIPVNLTGAARDRLAKVQAQLDALLHPTTDSPSMAKVRAAMIVEHQKMADAAAVPERSPVAPEDVHAVADEMGADHNAPDFKAATEAVTGEPHLDNLTPPELEKVHEAVIAEPEAFKEPQATETPSASVAEPTEFTTAKGSTYAINADGTTTRNKAARADPGHEGQEGPQPRSQNTFYVTKEQADELGLIQTQGGPRMAVMRTADGRIGVKYLDGKDAGMFERRTVVKPAEGPAKGLIPVETWKDGERVHFGNEITDVKSIPSLAEALAQTEVKPGDEKITAKAPVIATNEPEHSTRALTARTIEGTGKEKERGVSPGQIYHVGEEAPQIEKSEKLAEKDYPRAIAIAMREVQPPEGVHPQFVFMAVERKATREGDQATLDRLKNSRIAEEATTMGQQIAAWRNRDPLSAVTHVQSIENAREAAVKDRGVDVQKETQATVTEIKKSVDTQVKKSAALRPKSDPWTKFISSITCAS